MSRFKSCQALGAPGRVRIVPAANWATTDTNCSMSNYAAVVVLGRGYVRT
jgi:hypothetical protein